MIAITVCHIALFSWRLQKRFFLKLENAKYDAAVHFGRFLSFMVFGGGVAIMQIFADWKDRFQNK